MMLDIMSRVPEFNISCGIVWINLNYVVSAIPLNSGEMKVTLIDGSCYWLSHNWKDRDDVARFVAKMEGMK